MLAFCATGLMVALLVQVFADDAFAPPPVVPQHQARRDALPSPAPLGPVTMLATRPIFAPSRRAGRVGASADAQTSGGALTLVGTAVTRNYAAALVRVADGPVQSLRRGGRIGGWRIVAIGRNGVLVDSGSGRRRLSVGQSSAEDQGR